MINFSLNTCWRLIPTKGDKGAFSFAAFPLFLCVGQIVA